MSKTKNVVEKGIEAVEKAVRAAGLAKEAEEEMQESIRDLAADGASEELLQEWREFCDRLKRARRAAEKEME